jgi:predicted ATPase
MMLADRLLGAALLLGGSQSEARARLARGLERFVEPQTKKYQPAALFDQYLLARTLQALGLWLEGLVDTATAQIEACFREASARDSKFTLCEILRSSGCRVSIMNGDFAAAEQPVARLIDIASANSLGQYLQAGRCFEGMLLIKRGALDKGTAALRNALADCSAAGWTSSFPEFLGVLAEGLGGLGQAEAGLDTVAQALARAERGGERWYLPELLRIKGELLQQADQSAPAAEQCFHAALAAAREHGALSWELRAATSLARLKTSQNRPDAAREILAPVYAKFSEGFATADLRAARALLDV